MHKSNGDIPRDPVTFPQLRIIELAYWYTLILIMTIKVIIILVILIHVPSFAVCDSVNLAHEFW